MCENLEHFVRRLSYFSVDGRPFFAVRVLVSSSSGKSFILEKQDVWLSRENTSSTQGLILHIPLAPVLRRWGSFYTLSSEKWYAVIPSVVFSVLARSHFLKFCQFWKLSKMQKNFPFFWGFLVAWSKNACLFSRKMGHKDEEEEKVDWKKKTDFSSIFFFLCSSSKGVWSASLFSKCGTWQPDPVEMSSTQGSAKPKGKFILIFHGWNQNSITKGISTFFKKGFQKWLYAPWCAISASLLLIRV